MDASSLGQKLHTLRTNLADLGPSAVAFSAGVDSTLLLAVAQEALGNNVVALTADSPVQPARELGEARAFCEQRNIRHVVVPVNQFEIDGFAQNPANRCYLCKHHLLTVLKKTAQAEGFPTLLEGSNTSDLSDYRPGFEAVKELGVKSPLLEAQLSKQDIRDLSKHMNLPTWSKQSFACLATRFATNTPITQDGLKMVGEAEQVLLDLGVSTVRVRMETSNTNGAMARIEVAPHDFATVIEAADVIANRFKHMGFTRTTLDLAGYQTGSMNTL